MADKKYNLDSKFAQEDGSFVRTVSSINQRSPHLLKLSIPDEISQAIGLTANDHVAVKLVGTTSFMVHRIPGPKAKKPATKVKKAKK